MGEPVKIVDLAHQMIELSGLRPNTDIEIKFVGLRPGEKMFEEISHEMEHLTKSGYPKIFRFISKPQQLDVVDTFFHELNLNLGVYQANQLKSTVQKLVPEYRPFLDEFDIFG